MQALASALHTCDTPIAPLHLQGHGGNDAVIRLPTRLVRGTPLR